MSAKPRLRLVLKQFVRFSNIHCSKNSFRSSHEQFIQMSEIFGEVWQLHTSSIVLLIIIPAMDMHIDLVFVSITDIGILSYEEEGGWEYKEPIVACELRTDPFPRMLDE